MIDSTRMAEIYQTLKEIVFTTGTEKEKQHFSDIMSFFFKYSSPNENVTDLINDLNSAKATALYNEFKNAGFLKYLKK